MSLRAPVIALNRLKAGDRVGYGGTFRHDSKAEGYAAILAIGYADGMRRSFSNRGSVLLNGRPEKVIGIVSMDLCAVSCVSSTRVGDWAEILGAGIDPWTQAQAADTIPYELLTGLSSRVVRKYR
jgi:alanine racemase